MSSSANKRSVQKLVVDTGAFVRDIQIHSIGEELYAPPGLLDELKSARVRQKAELLPVPLKFVEPDVTAYKRVCDEAKKTGDYGVLSAVDLKVLALAYQLHQAQKSATSGATEEIKEETVVAEAIPEPETIPEPEPIAESHQDSGEVAEQQDEQNQEKSEKEEEEEEDSDEEGWVTEENLDEVLDKLNAFESTGEDSQLIPVACLSTDFAVQNVLLALDVPLVSPGGARIRRLRSWVLRCRACFSTTSDMIRKFCPSCGHSMLHRCAVSVDENGKQTLHINWRRLESTRGLRCSLPALRGGKHAKIVQHVEDQRIPHQRAAKKREEFLADPYGDSPFTMHDTTSRAAQLGIRHERQAAPLILDGRRNLNAGSSGQKKKRGGKKH